METVEELKATLAEREESLKRAWEGLTEIRRAIERYTRPDSLKVPEKSFEEQCRILADAIEEKSKKDSRVTANMIQTGRRVFSWIGRAPANEKEREEMLTLKRAYDFGLAGIVEGEGYESFYPQSDLGDEG